MTYATPELLLVGAAQNVVMLLDSEGGTRCESSEDFQLSDRIELW